MIDIDPTQDPKKLQTSPKGNIYSFSLHTFFGEIHDITYSCPQIKVIFTSDDHKKTDCV